MTAGPDDHQQPGRVPARAGRIGLSTYAYFWRGSDQVASPMSIDAMLADAHRLGAGVFQICDHPPIADADPAELTRIRTQAESLGIELELGTRGTDPAHLRRFVAIASTLGATVLRSMWTSGDDRPDAAETIRRLREIQPELEDAGIVLALETYEQVSSTQLVEVVQTLTSASIGICLDPANTVANLELPQDVTARCAPYVVDWHVKDFDFGRNSGWVGFVYTGTALGGGRLEYDAMHALLQPERRGINQIIEFWLPWQENADATVALEAEWTESAMDFLQKRRIA
jgi:sugar phosphate isomerase/epimerase